MAGEGGEGDLILLGALRLSGCPIPEDVQTISHVAARPELLVDLTGRSLWLISDGKVKVPVVLPSGIAARHRICTLIAGKIKEMGYLGDCGYNQLLYPSETSVRQLLVWLVERLPRVEEEGGGKGGQEELGPRTVLHRKIMAAVEEWCRRPYRHLAVATTALSQWEEGRLFGEQPQGWGSFRTYPLCVEDEEAPLVTKQVPGSQYCAPSILEAASLEASRAAQNRVVVSGEGGEQGGQGGQGMRALLRDALVQAARRRGEEGGGRGQEGGAWRGRSLGELVAGMEGEEDQRRRGGASSSSGFGHAVDFGQDHSHREAAFAASAKLRGGEGGRDDAASKQQGAEEGERQEEGERARREADAAQARREAELEALRRRLSDLCGVVSSLCGEREVEVVAVRQLEEEAGGLAQEAKALEKEYMTKRRTLELLPNAAENLVKLQEICAVSAKRAMDLAQEWEKHRRPLVSAIRRARDEANRRRARARSMAEEIMQCRSEMPSMVSAIRDREERARALEEEYMRMKNKAINRSMYTYRILDIIGSIAKQKKGIDSIIKDIREVQKEINVVNATLSRTDRITDEKIFKAGQQHKDPALVSAYRQLVDLRQRFERVVDVVRAMGQVDVQCRDVESKARLLASRLAGHDMDERIRGDLQQVRDENAAIMARIASGKARQHQHLKPTHPPPP